MYKSEFSAANNSYKNGNSNYGLSQSYSLSRTTLTNDFEKTFPSQYFMRNTFSDKINLIEQGLTESSSTRIFPVILQCLFQEPESCFYRIDLFQHFVEVLRMKSPYEYHQFFTVSALESFIQDCPYLEYISIIINELNKRGPQETLKHLESFLLKKVSQMTFEQKNARFYVTEVENFIKFKNEHPEKAYTVCSDEYLNFLEKAIKLGFEYIFPISKHLAPDFLYFVLVRFLLVLHPHSQVFDYFLVYDIANVLTKGIPSANAEAFLRSEQLLKELVLALLNILKINFLERDNFVGYNNLAIVINMIQVSELLSCIEKDFVDIIQVLGEKDVFKRVLCNLITANLTSNSCEFIRILVESCRVNMLYDHLYFIFDKVIIPCLVPKLRVMRVLEETLALCEYFFYGFSQIPWEFSIVCYQNFLEALIVTEARLQKERTRENLAKLNNLFGFIDCLEYLYQTCGNNKVLFQKLYSDTLELRKKYNISMLSETLIQKSLERRVWQISKDDLQNSMKQISTTEDKLKFLTIHPKFKRSPLYKGIKNVGNTCYLSSTMQALYMTEKFREGILVYGQEAFGNSSPNKNPDILLETLFVFSQLDPLSQEANCGDIKGIRETLPDRFRFSNQEQDASEFLKVYLDLLETRFQLTSTKSFIDDCFGGVLQISLTCSQCSKVRIQDEKFLDFLLNFDEMDGKLDQIKMFQRIFEKEELVKAVECEKCKGISPKTTKVIQNIKPPTYLILTLNRFKFDKVGVKITRNFDIADRIDLGQVFGGMKKNEVIYKLYAMIIHIGDTTEAGHYNVLIKNKRVQNGWFLIDDAECHYAEDIDLSEIFEKESLETPYILFYERIK